MFFLRPPSDARVVAELRKLVDAPFTHAPVGLICDTLTEAPAGFRLDAYGTELGRGPDTFDRARGAIARLDNYPRSFTRVVTVDDVLREGSLFATVATHLGFSSMHPCRVIAVVDESHLFSLCFGTLPGHAESGEERFQVVRRDDVVRYEVQAFSRPHDPLARLGAPVTRHYQKRFQRETLTTMKRLSASR